MDRYKMEDNEDKGPNVGDMVGTDTDNWVGKA